MPDRTIARVPFTDGATREVYEKTDGRQYVHDNDGERVYGVWVLPLEVAEGPVILPCSDEQATSGACRSHAVRERRPT